MTVGMNYQIRDEVHRRAKVTAEGLRMSLKEFLEAALDEKAERHKPDIAKLPATSFRRGSAARSALD